MRLVNARTRQLESFHRPPHNYAILSHTWGDVEVEFWEYVSPSSTSDRIQQYHKLHYACTQAIEDGLNYLWIDTICIDKTSSSELSEAINSMFRWYADAAVCYAYLEDVSGADNFNSSRWFTRGWTLQELVAPEHVHFYSFDWQLLGSKVDIAEGLSSLTKIDALVLTERECLEEFSIATRMRWAAGRETTRTEDMAYCLLGIFNVNMPLLYGEGDNAFVRLQEEILKRTSDDSILAWMHGKGQGNYLPSRVSSFASSRKVVRTSSKHHTFEFTELGLKVAGPVLVEEVSARNYRHRNLCLKYCECPKKDPDAEDETRVLYWLVLNCRFERTLEGYVAIEITNYGFKWSRVDRYGSVRIVSQKAVNMAQTRSITLTSNSREPLFSHRSDSSQIIRNSICRIEADDLLKHDFKVAHFSHDSRNYCWNPSTFTSELQLVAGFNISILRYFVVYNEYHREALLVTMIHQPHSRAYNDDAVYLDFSLAISEDHLHHLVLVAKAQVENTATADGHLSHVAIAALEDSFRDPAKWRGRKIRQRFAVVRSQEHPDGKAFTMDATESRCFSSFRIQCIPRMILGSRVWVLEISGTDCGRPIDSHDDRIWTWDTDSKKGDVERSPPRSPPDIVWDLASDISDQPESVFELAGSSKDFEDIAEDSFEIHQPKKYSKGPFFRERDLKEMLESTHEDYGSDDD